MSNLYRLETGPFAFTTEHILHIILKKFVLSYKETTSLISMDTRLFVRKQMLMTLIYYLRVVFISCSIKLPQRHLGPENGHVPTQKLAAVCHLSFSKLSRSYTEISEFEKSLQHKLGDLDFCVVRHWAATEEVTSSNNSNYN